MVSLQYSLEKTNHVMIPYELQGKLKKRDCTSKYLSICAKMKHLEIGFDFLP